MKRLSMPLLGMAVLWLSSSVSAVVYVKWDSPGPVFDGDSWETAYHTIQQGVYDADVANEEVWVAEGTYAESVTLKNGVFARGGYSGSGSVRNIRTHLTMIETDQAYSVNAVDQSAIDGFTLRGDVEGVYVSAGAPVISNCIMTGMTYGVYSTHGTSPVVVNSVLCGNDHSGSAPCMRPPPTAMGIR